VVVGNTKSSEGQPRSFPLVHPFQATLRHWLPGQNDAFITRLSSDGSTFLYSTYLGSGAVDSGDAVALDASNNIYVAGCVGAGDFYTTSNAVQTAFHGGPHTLYACGDAFLTKLDATGQHLLYSTYYGGAQYEDATSLAVDSVGNAYLTGQTSSQDILTSTNVVQPGYGGGNVDAFVLKLSTTSNHLYYATYLGGSGDEIGYSVALDAAGNAFVGGQTGSVDFPRRNQLPIGMHYGEYFVTALNPTASDFLYSTFLGGTWIEGGSAAVSLADDGKLWVAGTTSSSDFPTLNPAQPTYRGGNDGFITALSAVNACSPTTSGTSRAIDELGYDIYTVAVSCSGTGTMGMAPVSTSPSVTINIQRYYGPIEPLNSQTAVAAGTAMARTATAVAGTPGAVVSLTPQPGYDVRVPYDYGRIATAAVGDTVNSSPILEVEFDTLYPRESYAVSVNNSPPIPLLGNGNAQPGVLGVVSTHFDVRLLNLPRIGDMSHSAYNTSATLPPVAPNVFTFTHNGIPAPPSKVRLYLKGILPLVLENGSDNISSSGSPTPYGNEFGDWWPDVSRPYPDYTRTPWDPALHTFAYATRHDTQASIVMGGIKLYSEILYANTAYGTNQVNVLGHSAGGLWARQAAYNPSPVRTQLLGPVGRLPIGPIKNLMMLGTPNDGSGLTSRQILLNLNSCLYQHIAISCDMQQSKVEAYNRSHPPLPGVYYVAQAGATVFCPYCPFPIVHPDDGIVSDPSVNAFLDPYYAQPSVGTNLPPIVKVELFPNDRPDNTVHRREQEYHEFRDAFHPYFGELYTDQYPAAPSVLPAKTAPAPAALVYSVLTGTIQSSQVITRDLLLDHSDSANIALSWVGLSNTLAFTLTNPAGQVVSNTLDNGYDVVSDGGLHIVEYNIPQPAAGHWLAQLTANSQDSQDYILTAGFEGGLQLNPSVSSSYVHLGKPVQITASLTDDSQVRAASVTATISLQAGNTPPTTLVLNNVVGGVYSGQFIPTVEGNYSVVVQASGRNAHGEDFLRASDTSFDASSAAEFSGNFQEAAYDDNRNGLADRLVITATTNIHQSGQYQVHGLLTLTDGTLLTSASNYYTLDTGSQPLTLTFSGAALGQLNRDGPYQLRGLYLARALTSEVGLSYTDLAYTTTAYTRYNWERPNVLQTTPAQEEVWDSDVITGTQRGDGLYDYLKITVPVDVRVAGIYSASANLLDRNHNVVASAQSADFPLAAGDDAVVLRFPGNQVRTAGVDGPYSVTDLRVRGAGQEDYRHWVLTQTLAYQAASFDDAPCLHDYADVAANQVYNDFIRVLTCHQVFSGYADNTFHPADGTTRSELAKVVSLAFELPTANPTTPTYSDVPRKDIFYPYIEGVTAAGVMYGYSSPVTCQPAAAPCFKPGAKTSRADVAIVLRNVIPDVLVPDGHQVFADVPVGSYAYTATYALQQWGIISGYQCGPNLCFQPESPASRGQLSKMVYLTMQHRNQPPKLLLTTATATTIRRATVTSTVVATQTSTPSGNLKR